MNFIAHPQFKKKFISICFVLLTLLSITALYFYFFLYDEFLVFFKDYLSPDGNLEHPEAAVSRFFSAILFGFIFLYFLKYVKIRTVKVKSLLLRFCYTFSLFIAILHVLFQRNVLMFGEDGIMEWLTALSAFAASILFFISSRSEKKFEKKLIITVALLVMVFAFEEISWGQRILGWGTPDALSSLNYQNETNIHNMFQGTIPFFYVIILSILAAVFLFSDKIGSVVRKVKFLQGADKIFFAGEFYYFGYIFLFLAGYTALREGELSEVVFAVFALFYSVKFYRFRLNARGNRP